MLERASSFGSRMNGFTTWSTSPRTSRSVSSGCEASFKAMWQSRTEASFPLTGKTLMLVMSLSSRRRRANLCRADVARNVSRYASRSNPRGIDHPIHSSGEGIAASTFGIRSGRGGGSGTGGATGASRVGSFTGCGAATSASGRVSARSSPALSRSTFPRMTMVRLSGR